MDLSSKKPNLRPERPGLRPERLDLRPERPDLRSDRLDLRPERLDLRPERPDLRSKRLDLSIERLEKLQRGGTYGRTYGRTDGRTDGRTYVIFSPCVLQDIGPLGPLPKKVIAKILGFSERFWPCSSNPIISNTMKRPILRKN